jgi:hypothetical protein
LLDAGCGLCTESGLATWLALLSSSSVWISWNRKLTLPLNETDYISPSSRDLCHDLANIFKIPLFGNRIIKLLLKKRHHFCRKMVKIAKIIKTLTTDPPLIHASWNYVNKVKVRIFISYDFDGLTCF